jgi:hypothetical protein
MTNVTCDREDCQSNVDGECQSDEININAMIECEMYEPQPEVRVGEDAIADVAQEVHLDTVEEPNKPY